MSDYTYLVEPISAIFGYHSVAYGILSRAEQFGVLLLPGLSYAFLSAIGAGFVYWPRGLFARTALVVTFALAACLAVLSNGVAICYAFAYPGWEPFKWPVLILLAIQPYAVIPLVGTPICRLLEIKEDLRLLKQGKIELKNIDLGGYGR